MYTQRWLIAKTVLEKSRERRRRKKQYLKLLLGSNPLEIIGIENIRPVAEIVNGKEMCGDHEWLVLWIDRSSTNMVDNCDA